VELDRYLFGDIISIGWPDVAWCAAVAGIVFSLVLVQFDSLSLVTVSEDLAHVAGIPVRRSNYVFVLILTLAVALSIRLLGVVLVTSLVVIPPAAARNLACTLRQQVLFSVLAGLIGSAGGVMASYPLNLPTGPSITLTLAALFVITLGVSMLRRKTKPALAQP
jgi:ABC-type Mn2+/Zn2+ transport system permease subunit